MEYDKIKELVDIAENNGGWMTEMNEAGTTVLINISKSGVEEVRVSGEDLVTFLLMYKDRLVNKIVAVRETLTAHGITSTSNLTQAQRIDLLVGELSRK